MPYCALLKEVESLVIEAGRLADQARQRMSSELKPDGSIVTNADREVEEFLRRKLGPLVPGATTWGEEFGHEEPSSEGYWLIDPIDGTSNFRFGLPLWGITVGFMKDGILEVGCVSLPDLGWCLAAARGHGATCNGEPMPMIPEGNIRDEQLMGHGDSKTFAIKWPGKMRHVGSFVAEAAMVARQNLRAMASSRAKLYDAAGGVVICREVGAEIRELDGTTWNEADWQQPKQMNSFVIGPPRSNFPFHQKGS